MLYHGTSERHLETILQFGLQARRTKWSGNWDHSCSSNPNAVYLSVAYALYFATATIDITDEQTRLIVIEVDETQLDTNLLRADEDALEQLGRGRDGLPKNWTMKKRNEYYRKRIDDYPHTVSLAALGNCTYLSDIPTAAIQRVAFVDQRVYSEMMLRGYDPTITVMNYRLLGQRYRDATTWLFDPHLITNTLEDFGLVKTMSLPLPDTRDGIEVIDFAQLLSGFTANQGPSIC